MQQLNVMANGTLVRIRSNHRFLRTDEVYGAFLLPEEGESFVIIGEALSDHGNVRVVETTEILRIVAIDDNSLCLYTRNSEYLLKNIRTRADELDINNEGV